MPITPFLIGRSYQPETLQCMGVAFETVCQELGLADRGNPYAETVAELVITFADRDERDPVALSQRVLDTLRKR
jgi:hypothetical protein